MRKAVVDKKTGLVLNVIEIEDGANWPVPEGCYLVNATKSGGPGDTWTGRVFTPAPEPEPTPPGLEERIAALEAKGQGES